MRSQSHVLTAGILLLFILSSSMCSGSNVGLIEIDSPVLLPGTTVTVQRLDFLTSHPQCVNAHDLEGDGDLDLFYSTWRSGAIQPLVRSSSGWSQPYTYDTGHFTEGDHSAGDFDNDGAAEILMGGGRAEDPGFIFPVQWTGSALVSGGSVATGKRPRSCRIRDLNGDGRNDLLYCAVDVPAVGYYLRDLSNSLGSELRIPLNRSWAVDSGDLDGDLDEEMVAAADNRLALARWVGSGFDPIEYLDAENRQAWDVVIGDADGDGDNDIAATGAGAVWVFPNSGGALGEAIVQLLPDGEGAGIAIGDVGRDGIHEIAVANGNWAADVANASCYLFRFSGSTLHLHSTLGVAANPRSVLIADLDGDHLNDIATANEDGHSISIFLVSPQCLNEYAPDSASGIDLSGSISGIKVRQTSKGWRVRARLTTYQTGTATTTAAPPYLLEAALLSTDYACSTPELSQLISVKPGKYSVRRGLRPVRTRIDFRTSGPLVGQHLKIQLDKLNFVYESNERNNFLLVGPLR